jgi:lincosamide nucleotidyltransferase A/C/D/E
MASAGRGRVPQADMDAEGVIRVLDALLEAQVRTWLLGGWAIDALVGRTRRPHDDVDLLIADAELGTAVAVLGRLGYAGPILPEGSSYLVDPAGRQVDVHAIRFRLDGSAVYRMEDGSDWVYPAGTLEARGIIAGRTVPCLTAEMMMVEHTTGYTLDEVHRGDVAALAEAFGLAVPDGRLSSG